MWVYAHARTQTQAVANSLEEMEALEQELLSTRRQLSDDLAQEQRERSRLAEQVRFCTSQTYATANADTRSHMRVHAYAHTRAPAHVNPFIGATAVGQQR